MRVNPKQYTLDALQRVVMLTALRTELARVARLADRKRAYLARRDISERMRGTVMQELDRLEMHQAHAEDLLTILDDRS